MTRLGDHVDILSGYAFDSSEFSDSGKHPLVRIRDVVPGKTSTYYSGSFDPTYLVENGDLLVGMDGNFNRATWSGGKALLNQRVCRVTARSESLDQRYLFHFLPAALKMIEDATSYATVKHLSVKTIRDIPIDLPPLPEQRRIASILDQADELRAKRRRAGSLLDGFSDSLFGDMFGDLVANGRNWPMFRVSDFVAGFSSGKSLTGPSNGFDSPKPRVLKISAVTSGRFDPAESKPLPPGYEPPESHFVAQGDLLFSRANTAELVGATAYVNDEVQNLTLPDKLWKFLWPEVPVTSPLFVWKLFSRREFRGLISERATGSSGSMKNVSQSAIMSIPIALPPLIAQERFSKAISEIETMRRQHEVSLKKLDELFASLQHRAFRGEL